MPTLIAYLYSYYLFAKGVSDWKKMLPADSCVRTQFGIKVREWYMEQVPNSPADILTGHLLTL